MVRVILPQHLQVLAQCPREIQLDVVAPVTTSKILDALEERFPQLTGTIRDHVTRKRRAMVRFFVCQEDISQDSPEVELPEKIARGEEAFYIIAAIAGGAG